MMLQSQLSRCPRSKTHPGGGVAPPVSIWPLDFVQRRVLRAARHHGIFCPAPPRMKAQDAAWTVYKRVLATMSGGGGGNARTRRRCAGVRARGCCSLAKDLSFRCEMRTLGGAQCRCQATTPQQRYQVRCPVAVARRGASWCDLCTWKWERGVSSPSPVTSMILKFIQFEERIYKLWERFHFHWDESSRLRGSCWKFRFRRATKYNSFGSWVDFTNFRRS